MTEDELNMSDDDYGRMIHAFNSVEDWALIDSAFTGDMEMLENCLACGAKSNVRDYDGSTALHIAYKNGHKDFCELLIDAGADPNAVDRKGNIAMPENEDMRVSTGDKKPASPVW